MTLDLYTELGFLHDTMLKGSSEISKSNNISELLGLANAQLELVTTSCELKALSQGIVFTSIETEESYDDNDTE